MSLLDPEIQARVLQAAGESREPTHVQIGWITGAQGGTPLVDIDGSPGPVRARSTLKLSPQELLAAAASRQGAVLLFEARAPASPILVGLLQTASETPLLDQLLGQPLPATPVVQVDDKRVVVEGKDEVVLQCGEASITLRRNGRVTIRGTQLETQSSGLHRIRGAKVEIN